MNVVSLTLAMLMTGTPADAAKPVLERASQTEFALGGPLKAQIDGVIKNWLLPLPETNPAVLTMFRDRDKPPYQDYLPWSGEFAGKYLTAATQVLRLTGDPALKGRLSKFVNDLVALQDADGYLGPFPKDHRLTGWAPNVGPKGGPTWDAWGHYHAMLGLLLWHEETGDAKALAAARKIGDLLCDTFKNKTVVSTGSAEMNHAVVHSLALLNKRTGDKRYLDLAEKVVAEFAADGGGNYLEGALAGEEFFQLPLPRWESLHPIMGLAELYWTTGKRDYRDAFEHLYWSIAKTDRHNNGGFSSGEQAQGNPYHPGAIETCCTIAWTAMGVEMLRMTGDPRVADELELSTLNQIVGLHSPDGSWCTYNTPMDGVRIPSTEDIAFQIRPGSEGLNCCSVNAARGFGMISDWALMRRDGGLVLNWYGPSTLTSRVGDVVVMLRQETEYPRNGGIVLRVDPATPTRFALQLRVPHWSKRTTIRVNGVPVDAPAGKYATIERTWKAGDKVAIDLDMRPRFWVGQRECRNRASVYRGPILMALETPGSLPTYQGAWETAGMLRVTKTAGATAEYQFRGDFVRLRARRYDDAGQGEIFIDGKPIEVIDWYGPQRDVPFVWERKGLGPGVHTIRIVSLGKKQEASKNVWINVASIEPGFVPPSLDARTLKPTSDGYDAKTPGGQPIRLRPFGWVGQNRTPYVTWLPSPGVKAAPFSRENPSRTSWLEE